MNAPARHVGLVRAVMQGREGLTGDGLVAAVTAAGGIDARTHRSAGTVSFTAQDSAPRDEHLVFATTDLRSAPAHLEVTL